jgi:hypothetical protein
MSTPHTILRPLPIALVTLALLTAGGPLGCALTKPKRFSVSSSSVNWVEIVYLGTNQPSSMARISLIGSGSIQLRRGNSPRVLDDFAGNTAHPNWDDYKQDELNVSSAEIRQVFQALVNRGVCDKEPKHPEGSPVLPMAKLNGRLDGERFFRHTTEPDLLEVVTRLLALIDSAGQPPPLEIR